MACFSIHFQDPFKLIVCDATSALLQKTSSQSFMFLNILSKISQLNINLCSISSSCKELLWSLLLEVAARFLQIHSTQTKLSVSALIDLSNRSLYAHSYIDYSILVIHQGTWTDILDQYLVVVVPSSSMSGAAARTIVVLFQMQAVQLMCTKMEVRFRHQSAHRMSAVMTLPFALHLSAKCSIVDRWDRGSERLTRYGAHD